MDEAVDEAQHEQSLPELRDLFAELHKLRSDLKKEQRVKEHREQECAEAEKAPTPRAPLTLTSTLTLP